MAIGLFDEQGGASEHPVWQVTAPVFQKVTIHLHPEYSRGRTFEIVAENASPRNIYIKAATLNNAPLTKFWSLIPSFQTAED